MARLILIICAIAGVWMLLRRLLKRSTDRASPRAERPVDYTPTERCGYCGAYVDRRLMRFDEDRGYRCREHDLR